MLSASNRVGRLLEISLQAPVLLEQVTAAEREVRAILGRSAARLVSCIDLRGSRVLPQEVVDGFIGLLRVENPRIERSALIVPKDNAVLGLQVERMVRDAGLPARRAFRDMQGMTEWLGEALYEGEQHRLRSFLMSSPPVAS